MAKQAPTSAAKAAKKPKRSTRKQIVILGAGFAGLSTALELAKRRDVTQTADITLIDQNDYQLFTPDLYEVASAGTNIPHENRLQDSVCVNLRQSLRRRDVRAHIATITGLDRKTREVHTTKGVVHYDYLVVALGSAPFYFGIPGMQEHSVPLKTVDHAMHIRRTIHQLMATQDDVHIILCGAGAAGVEVAAELSMTCKRELKDRCFRLTLVEAQNTVLAQFHEDMQKYAAQRLKSLGVNVATNFMITKAEDGTIHSKDGQILKADLIIWTGGIAGGSILEQLGFEVGKRGQIPVKPTLMTTQDKRVFALGDAAEVPIPDGKYAIQTAHEAVHQGPLAARNVARTLAGAPQKDLETYTPEELGYVVALGGKHGMVGLPSGRVLTGPIGWFARKYVDFRHFRQVLPFSSALAIWFRGLRTMNRNDHGATEKRERHES